MSARRMFDMLAAAAFCAALAALGFTSAESAEMKKARALFEAKRFDEALPIYEGIARANPDSAVANFNVGIALYGKREFIKAVEDFQKALATEDRAVEKAALSFIGNSYFNLAEEAEKINETLAAKAFREALGYYGRAMELDNGDRIVRYNYELAKKRLHYLAEGSDDPKKAMLRMTVGALAEESRALALARKTDLERREEDSKLNYTRREEDRRKRESRREEDRATDRERRMEDEEKGVRPGLSKHELGLTPFAREEARRAEDAAREEARRVEDAGTEERRRQDDAEREEKRLREGTIGQAQPTAKTGGGWLERIFGGGTAWAEKAAPAVEAVPTEGATPATAPGLYAKRRSEDLARESARRAEDDELDRRRRLEDANESSMRRVEDAGLPPEKRGPDSELALKREKEDLEKELERLKEDRVIIIKRKKEDIALMMERSKADAEAERSRKDALERKALASEDGVDELKALAQSAGQAAAALEEAAGRGQQAMSQIESAQAAQSAEDAASASGGAGGAGGGGQDAGSLGEMINREKSRLSQDMSVTAGQELGSEITGQLAEGGGGGSGAPPKAERSALEELEDALMKRAKEAGAEERKRKEEGETPETIRDKDAELLLETYWMGEAPKKIIEREKSPDYGKEEKNW